MSKPLPGLDVPVVNPQTGLMSQTWYEFFSGFRLGAWATWTPTLAMSVVGGTPITAALSGGGNGARYKYLEPWKLVIFTIDATISNVGIGNNGAFLFSLPIPGLNASVDIIGSGREAITLGKGLSVYESDATHGSVLFTDNTSLLTGGNGTRPVFGGMYETA